MRPWEILQLILVSPWSLSKPHGLLRSLDEASGLEVWMIEVRLIDGETRRLKASVLTVMTLETMNNVLVIIHILILLLFNCSAANVTTDI